MPHPLPILAVSVSHPVVILFLLLLLLIHWIFKFFESFLVVNLHPFIGFLKNSLEILFLFHSIPINLQAILVGTLFIFHLIRRVWDCFSKRLFLKFIWISLNCTVVSFLFNLKELEFYVVILIQRVLCSNTVNSNCFGHFSGCDRFFTIRFKV